MQLISVFAFLLTLVSALKFEIEAQPKGTSRCIRDFVGSESLVVVKVKSNGHVGDGQRLSMEITDSKGNRHSFRDNVVDTASQLISPTPDTSFDICFTNYLDKSTGSAGRKTRNVELDVQIGANARDWASFQAAGKLKPAEVTLRQLSERVQELYHDLEYMRSREEKLRDTNESTNRRVKNFFIIILLSFIGLGAWQIQFLRGYFRSKHII